MTEATSAPSGLAGRRLGCPPASIGPSKALADDEDEFKPLITDFASGPLEREPPCREADLAGFGVDAAAFEVVRALPSSMAVRGATPDAGGAPSTTLSTLSRSALPPRLLGLTLPRPPSAAAAEDVIGVATDRADFLSKPLRAIAADDFRDED